MQTAIAGATFLGQSLPPLVKQAKVIGVHRDDHTIDVAFLDGATARRVPVLSGWLGSTHGIVGMTAPTYDKGTLAKKTYPAAANMEQAPTNGSAVGRDQYAAVMQMEGIGLGASGFVCVGFFAPQVSEMLFPKDEEGGEVNAFSDLTLIRHPSDVQTTVDKSGKVSIQHPAGTRITIGTGSVNLTKKDYDKRYELRHNKTALKDVEAVAMGTQEVAASLLLQTQERADLYGKQEVNLHTKTTTYINMNEGGTIDIYASSEITVHTGGGATITLSGGDISIDAPGTVAVHGSQITLN